MTTLHSYVVGLLSLAVLVTAVILIRATLQPTAERTMPLRPVATLLIMLIAIVAPMPVSPFFKAAIILGLALSLVADAILVTASSPPIIGVAISLIVYLLYWAAFASQTAWQWPTPWLLLLLIYAVLWYFQVAPYLREVKGDVIAYMIFLFFMCWQALELSLQTRDIWAVAALVGALLLALTDSLRGLAHFRDPAKGGLIKNSAPLALSTYIVAQWLLAISLWGDIW